MSHGNLSQRPICEIISPRSELCWLGFGPGLALMGFGFVVARFGLFLQEFQAIQHIPASRHYGPSLWFGVALIAAGVLVNVFAGWHHARLIRALNRADRSHSRSSMQPVAIALFLALVGLAMAIYLISVRSSAQSFLTSNQEAYMAAMTDNGIINRLSAHSVDETVEKLKGILQAKGVTLFALVDHSGEAAKVGMKMRPTKLLIFGSPKAGTPLMLTAPSIAIDLPLKILVWEDEQGKVWASYNSSAYLQRRHGLPQPLLENIAVVETLAAKAGE
ncbi:MAG TPA: DUF302 domain-containing protein [Terriglobales bacterium]|nr:DUF302 domain-containing protein [Terriglobales bacterium]